MSIYHEHSFPTQISVSSIFYSSISQDQLSSISYSSISQQQQISKLLKKPQNNSKQDNLDRKKPQKDLQTSQSRHNDEPEDSRLAKAQAEPDNPFHETVRAVRRTMPIHRLGSNGTRQILPRNHHVPRRRKIPIRMPPSSRHQHSPASLNGFLPPSVPQSAHLAHPLDRTKEILQKRLLDTQILYFPKRSV